MSKTKRLSDAEIANKIRKGDDFKVRTNTDRKRALMVAKVLNSEIITWRVGCNFQIHIPSEITN